MSSALVVIQLLSPKLARAELMKGELGADLAAAAPSSPRFRHSPRRRIRIRWTRFASCRAIARRTTRCHYLAPARIAKLPVSLGASVRYGWRIVARLPRAVHARHGAMGRELRRRRPVAMTRAPYAHDFAVRPSMTPAWFATDSARASGRRDPEPSRSRTAAGRSTSISRSMPVNRVRATSQKAPDWEWISTIDNGRRPRRSAFSHAINSAKRDQRYERAILSRSRLSARIADAERLLPADLSAPGQLS